MTRGIVYLASGNSYIQQARESAESVKRHNPSLPVTLYSDEAVDADAFSQVIEIDEPVESKGDSILSERYMPYDQNLYLDVDTYVCADITDVFELLDRYDLAVARNSGGQGWNRDVYDEIGQSVPDAFSEYNTGVVAYNNCKVVKELFIDWNERYRQIDFDEIGRTTNQPAFTLALYNSDIDFVTLSPEYNFQINSQRFASGKIKVLHSSGRAHVEFEMFSQIANNYEGSRTITWDDYPCRVVTSDYRSKKYNIQRLMQDESARKRLLQRAKRKWKQDGMLALMKSALKKINAHL